MRLDVSVLRHAHELEQLEPEWSALLERSDSNQPTLSPLWIRTWWSIFGHDDGRDLRVLLFWDRGRLVGLAPLQARRYWYRPGLPYRRLELLASGEAEADEICSDYIGVVAERGAEEDVARGVVTALEAGALGGWDELVLPAMDGASALTSLLTGALTHARIATESVVTSEAPYVPLPATWAAYLEKLPSSRRYLVTRSLRDYEKWAAGDSRLHVASTPAELVEGQRVLHSLHGERWGAEGEGGVFRSERFTKFHERVMAALLERNALELSWLTVRGEPIAALYNIVWDGKIHFYQSGRKIELPKGIRPGIVAHAYALQRAIAAGRREYDFLAGASQYKMQLALATRPLVRVRAVRAPMRERSRVAVERLLAFAPRLRARFRA
ncbi:MAG TPA: GNAT family N-acetyltransferase [Polyangia bacterium]|nr:GNAT family N-acetyltransferase [Polyangia bacterium]